MSVVRDGENLHIVIAVSTTQSAETTNGFIRLSLLHFQDAAY